MSKMTDRDELDQGVETVLLPLFPLRLVLFPGQVLPLHIFEPRYRLMINHCVDEGQPFGVVLMHEDSPDWRHYSGEVTLPHDVGTTAHIRQVERLPNGRLNIITVGLHRFRVRQLHFDMPYLQGEVLVDHIQSHPNFHKLGLWKSRSRVTAMTVPRLSMNAPKLDVQPFSCLGSRSTESQYDPSSGLLSLRQNQ